MYKNLKEILHAGVSGNMGEGDESAVSIMFKNKSKDVNLFIY